ncbi:MAG TPA: ion channel [Acidobacteriaceae bacterium]|nr:ion channel [Acidobacteriaceae bacterium]
MASRNAPPPIHITGLVKRRFQFMGREKRSSMLLVSIVLLFILSPILENYATGGLLLILNLYITLIAATSELADKRALFWSAIPMAIASMILVLATHYYHPWLLVFANYLVLAVFLALVSGSLFIYLGQKGKIAKDRILVSVSLYFLLGLTWFAIYNVINLVQPGSFAEAGKPLTGITHWSTMLYFSLVTLTTLGYGDIVAIKPAARMFATLEAAAGVLYIAITVARLVAAQPSSKQGER